jgi:Tfp pilus assembly protein PilF
MTPLQCSVAALALALLAGCGGSSEPGPTAGTDPGLALLAQARAELVGKGVPRDSGRAPLAAARAHLAAGREERARELVEPELEGPAQAEAHYLLGVLESRALRWGRAAEAFEPAFAPGPGYPERVLLPFKYGRALEELGRIEAARAAFELDHELSGDGEALFRLGLFDLEAGDLVSADARLADARRRFTVPRDVARVLVAQADLALAREDAAAARRLLEEAVQRAPQRASLARLARLCRELGDEESALRFEAALERLP